MTTASDLTLLRTALHHRVLQRVLPPGAGRDDVERLLLAFEELTSNGLRHGRGPVQVAVAEQDDGWLIDVSDAGIDHTPAPAVGRDPAHGGLGLYLVARLSATHGWWIHNHRKHVWASVRGSVGTAASH